MTSLGLDAGTLMFSTALLAFLTSGFSFISASSLHVVRECAAEWAKAMLTLGIACLLWFLTPSVPHFFSFVLGNAMSVVSPIFVLRAVHLLAGQRFSLVAALTVFLLGTSGIFTTYFFGVDRSATVLTIAATHMTVALLGFWTLTRQPGLFRSPYVAVTGTVLLLLGAATAARVWVTLFGAGAEAVLPVAPSNTQVFSIAAATLLIVAGSFGFLGALAERARLSILDSASRDGLTGLFTRAAFYERVQQALTRRADCAALVMVDIDHFKRINDTYGHLAGDAVIRHASKLILRTIRSEDLAGRYGGEEFCVFMPGCSLDAAQVIANRFVADASQQKVRLPNGETISYTLSAGYMSFDIKDSVQPLELDSQIELADLALYEAKRNGRNRAVAASAKSRAVLEADETVAMAG